MNNRRVRRARSATGWSARAWFFASEGDFHYLGQLESRIIPALREAAKQHPLRKQTMVENSELRKAGLKVTLPRVKILQMLDNDEHRHMSAEDVYKALMEAGEDVGLATVYRVLTQVEAAGLVVRHNFDGGDSVFELAASGHHDHMVCGESGEVIEFFDGEIDRRQKEIVKEHGFELVDHNLVLYVRRKD